MTSVLDEEWSAILAAGNASLEHTRPVGNVRPDPCPACHGLRAHIVRKGTDYEDVHECSFCHGTGIRKEET